MSLFNPSLCYINNVSLVVTYFHTGLLALKIIMTIHIVGVYFLFKVFGMENWSISDPDINSVATPEMKYRPANFTFQFAVAFLVFVFVYIVQVGKPITCNTLLVVTLKIN